MTTAPFQRLLPLPVSPQVPFWIHPYFEPVYSIKLTLFTDPMLWDLKVFISPVVLKFNFSWVGIIDFHLAISGKNRQDNSPHRPNSQNFTLARVPGLSHQREDFNPKEGTQEEFGTPCPISL